VSSSGAGAGGFRAPGAGAASIGGGGFVKPGTTGNVGSGGFVKPGATAGGLGGGGFVKPGATGAGLGAGGFVKPGATGTGLGAGGFVKPGATGAGLGAGGFAKPGVSGAGGFGNSGGSSSSGGFNKVLGGAGLAGGAGALGGLAANRYSYPKSSSLGSIFSKKPKTASAPGYGTAWGTKFDSKSVYKQKKGFSKKALGLGVAAGFVGGAALGVAGTMATYSVYHRYQNFKNMMSGRGFDGYGNNNNDFYNSYTRNECIGGCPFDSHCEWGFCECNNGYERRFGRCGRVGSIFTPRPAQFDPFVTCANIATCQGIDINMICNTELTVQAGGKCECKQDMKWNANAAECQMFIDVDCSAVTYDTPPSKIILDAVKQAEANNIVPVPQEAEIRTPTIEESVGSSLLSQIDKERATAAEMKEAFCRDVDSFSFDFNVDDGKPPKCEAIPRNVCGVLYDSSSCSGGWKLYINEGQISFPYFSSYWKYRNDADLVGVKAGCTLTAFSDTGYSGKRGTFRADAHDQWWVLEDYADFAHLENDIESVQCVCRKF